MDDAAPVARTLASRQLAVPGTGRTPRARGGATFSPCGLYRYRLWRAWEAWRPRVLVVALNPSTADAARDDRTVAKLVRMARGWGCGSLELVNLFAWRATRPSALATVADPVGPQNDAAILAAAARPLMVVAAWGADPFARVRAAHVLELLTAAAGRHLHCLRVTGDGQPWHPLYLPDATKPFVYREARHA